jgi:hypothetical protein
MANSLKSRLVNLFTTIVLFLTAFQGMIPTMPVTDTGTITIISAITIFLVTGFTAWKQALSVEINNVSLWSTLAVALLATLGGLNTLFDVVHFKPPADQWIRFSLTALIACINLASKTLWPTKETKSTL